MRQTKNLKRTVEKVIQIVFLMLGLVTVGCVPLSRSISSSQVSRDPENRPCRFPVRQEVGKHGNPAFLWNPAIYSYLGIRHSRRNCARCAGWLLNGGISIKSRIEARQGARI